VGVRVCVCVCDILKFAYTNVSDSKFNNHYYIIKTIFVDGLRVDTRVQCYFICEVILRFSFTICFLFCFVFLLGYYIFSTMAYLLTRAGILYQLRVYAIIFLGVIHFFM